MRLVVGFIMKCYGMYNSGSSPSSADDEGLIAGYQVKKEYNGTFAVQYNHCSVVK